MDLLAAKIVFFKLLFPKENSFRKISGATEGNLSNQETIEQSYTLVHLITRKKNDYLLFSSMVKQRRLSITKYRECCLPSEFVAFQPTIVVSDITLSLPSPSTHLRMPPTSRSIIPCDVRDNPRSQPISLRKQPGWRPTARISRLLAANRPWDGHLLKHVKVQSSSLFPEHAGSPCNVLGQAGVASGRAWALQGHGLMAKWRLIFWI